ncbi:hypothetical protein JCM21531_4572 [Acetivibrio straminisolvens JCM 21531]|uniref:Uncharacterized protein n=2 Tax=Acetivibrio straminisolvens TaxID=253314 RepID=W4VCJ4_9FIRM|nr:hypothetical protein JCM21531_4572 [Acetivibrio straminisolvens JCM 21531]
MRKILILITVLSLFTITACSKIIDNNSVNNSSTDNRTELADIYILALDSIMPIDEGLNGDMKYI